MLGKLISHMTSKRKSLSWFLTKSTHAFDKYSSITLTAFLIIIMVISGINGQLFFLVNAQPERSPSDVVRFPDGTLVSKNITTQHVPLEFGFLNIITKVNNLLSLGPFGPYSNGTRAPGLIPAEGTLKANDFKYNVYNGDLSGLMTAVEMSLPGKPAELGKGQIVKLSPGGYQVWLVSPKVSPYMTDMSPDCTGTIKTKEVKECIITHTYIGTATVNVITRVDNIGGGTAKAEDTEFAWVRCESGTNAEGVVGADVPGKKMILAPYTVPWKAEPGAYCYAASPEPSPGYITRTDGECKNDRITAGETNECNLTYKFVGKATLKVTTTVDNSGGGTFKPEDFSFYIVNNGESPYFSFAHLHSGNPTGEAIELSAGSYHLSEEGHYVPPGYLSSESSGCWGVISVGETRDCHVTKTFKP